MNFKKIVKSTTITTSTTPGGKIKVGFDTSELQNLLQNTDKSLKKVTKDRGTLIDMAYVAIDAAYDMELIPYKSNYKLKTVKNNTPNKKSWSPSDYYTYQALKVQSLSGQPRFNKAGTKVLGTYGDKDFSPSKKRVHWYEVRDSAPEYNKSYTRVTKEHKVNMRNKYMKKPKKSTRKTVSYYSDRPPHLNDVDTTHLISTSSGYAQIMINARKPKDERFMNVGGEEYGLIQYTSDDTNWKRSEEGTTSFWLHVALGLTDNLPVKIKNKTKGKKNFESMVEVMADALSKANKNIKKKG